MRPIVPLLAVVAAVALTGCGGDDEQARAFDAVCAARADLAEHTDALKALTLEDVAAGRTGEALAAIGDDLKAIRAAQPDLADERKAEVKEATDAFAADVRGVARDLATGLTREAASEQVRAALGDLSTAFREAYDPVDCGDA